MLSALTAPNPAFARKNAANAANTAKASAYRPLNVFKGVAATMGRENRLNVVG